MEVETLATTASTTATSLKTMDFISVPAQRAGAKSPSGSPHRSPELTTTLQNEDLQGILDMMKAKITAILSSFETRRHVTSEDRGVLVDLSALNNRAIELQEGINKKPPPRSTATQTEAEKTKRSQVAPPRQALPNVQVRKTDNHRSAAKSTGKAVPTTADSKPESYASVAKDANKDEEWAKVKPKRLRKKPEALILKKTGEVTYADMLRKMKAEPSLTEFGKHVRKIRRTQQGELLLELEGKASEVIPSFKNELEATLKEIASVRTGAHRTALICSGLDETTTAQDLHNSLVSQFQGIRLEPEDVRGLRRMRDGTQIASVLMCANDAIAVINRGVVTVGWSRCRIAQDVRPIRCFRCLEFGHRAPYCKSVDRSDCCLRCGEHGHKAKGCVAPPRCLICSSDVDKNHATGGFACPTYKANTKGANSRQNDARRN